MTTKTYQCNESPTGGHHWNAEPPGRLVVHCVCRYCGTEKDIELVPFDPIGSSSRNSNEVRITKHEEYEDQKQEIIAEYSNQKSNVAATAEAMDIPRTTLNGLLSRWMIK